MSPDGRWAAFATDANYDVSPDGTKLLLIRPVQDALVMVVYNWRAELRHRLAGVRR